MIPSKRYRKSEYWWLMGLGMILLGGLLKPYGAPFPVWWSIMGLGIGCIPCAMAIDLMNERTKRRLRGVGFRKQNDTEIGRIRRYRLKRRALMMWRGVAG